MGGMCSGGAGGGIMDLKQPLVKLPLYNEIMKNSACAFFLYFFYIIAHAQAGSLWSFYHNLTWVEVLSD